MVRDRGVAVAQAARGMIANAGHLGPISWPVSRATRRNQLEPHGTEPRTEWQISAVLSMVLVRSRENKWCPEEDSNLHALASAST